MRSVVVLLTGFALLVAGIIVLALTDAALLGVALLAVGLVTKIGGLLLGHPPTGPGRPSPPRAVAGRAGVVPGHDRRRAS